MVQQKDVEDERGRNTEIDDVGKRVHLHPEARRRLQETRDASVYAVEEGGQQDHRNRELETILESQADARKTRTDRQNGDHVGDHQP